MIAQIVSNPATKQGSKSDVEQHFSIEDAISIRYTTKQLRGLCAAESLPFKVAGYMPSVMGNVSFASQHKAQDSGYAEDDLQWITDQLKRLVPWMVQAQTKANICGKAYVIYEAERLSFDVPNETFVNQDIPVSPVNISLQELENTPDGSSAQPQNTPESAPPGVGNGFGRPVPPNDTLNGSGFARRGVNNGFVSNQPSMTQEQLINYFPLLAAIDWRDHDIQRLTPFQVVAGDNYVWSSDRKYLYRKNGSFSTQQTGVFSNTDIYGVSRVSVNENDVLQWAQSQLNGSTATGGTYQSVADRIKDTQYEVIEASHVIEITAFDYQDDTDADMNETDSYCLMEPGQIGGIGQRKVSYRLVRFVTALLRYLSFVNATLNRMHRSEFIAYGKEGLGDINLDIARQLAQTSRGETSSSPDGTLNLHPVDVIQAELDRILDSAKNQGIIMYDAKHKVELIARTMSGIDKLHDVFSSDLIAASGLTEFTLFGKNNAGAGLASLDIRDRKFIADQADQLWADHWYPIMVFMARNLAYSTDSISEPSEIELQNEKSFKLTDSEAAEYLDKMIKPRILLIDKQVFSPQEIRRELLGNSLLANYFSISIVEGETPEDNARRAIEEAANSIQAANAGNNSGTSDVNFNGSGQNAQPDGVPITNSRSPVTAGDTTRQGDSAAVQNRADAIAVYREWQTLTNMTVTDMERWRMHSSVKTEKADKMINKIVRLLTKPVADWSRRDINAAKTELRTLKRLRGRWQAGQNSSRMIMSLMNHGYNPGIVA